jgi:hypothetical protein
MLRDIDVIIKKIIIFVINVVDDPHATRFASIRVARILSPTGCLVAVKLVRWLTVCLAHWWCLALLPKSLDMDP